jgi:ferric-dicitrate binding protein FerR (iron transport regulator)
LSSTAFWKRERQVDLSGEAYFEVSRNKTKPFVVNSNDVRTCVLGTKFNVRARPSEEKVVTTLLKGSVKVQLPGQSEEEGILLKPGQMLSVDTRTMQPMLTEANRPGDVLLWINGKLKFEQATLQEIVQCLEKHFDVHFIISDAQLQKDRFTCTFSTDDDIRQILSINSLECRVVELREKDNLRNWKNPVTGDWLMDVTGLKPGRIIGEVLSATKEAIMEGEISNDKSQAQQFAIEWLRVNKAILI